MTAAAAHGAATEPAVAARFDVGDGIYVRALAVEPAARLLWVGTSTGVLAVELESERVRHTFDRSDGLANEYVFAIGFDDRGNKWFGTNAGGASTWRDGRWRTFFPMHGLADYWVYAFAQQRNGAFWIGTWEGASRVDLDDMSFTNYVDELVNEWVYGLAVDASDRVWFATEGGVSRLDGASWRHWTHEDGVGAANVENLEPSANTGLGTRSRHDLTVATATGRTYNPGYVFAIHAARDGRIVAGTWGGGVAMYQHGEWRNFSTRDGLSGNLVYAIAETADGRLWFGTDRGVSILDAGRWQTIDEHAGHPLADVYALAATPGGEVWAGLKGAVLKITTTPRD